MDCVALNLNCPRAEVALENTDRWQMREIVGSEGWVTFNSLDAVIDHAPPEGRSHTGAPISDPARWWQNP